MVVGMDQRVSFITLAVSDLATTRRFYVDGLGWEPALEVPDDVLMFHVADKVVLSLWSESGFEAEVGPIRRGEGVAPITISHNLATSDEVDAVLEDGPRGGCPAAASGASGAATPATSPIRTASGGRSPPTPARSARRSCPEPSGQGCAQDPGPRSHDAGRVPDYR